MPRDSQGVWFPPLGTKGVANTPIASAPYNGFVDEMQTLANEARPITAGGTGATTAEAAKVNLNITAAGVGAVAKAGDRMTGSLSSAVKDHATLGTVTEEYKYADANTHKVTINGAHVINPTGLAEGDVMQINVLYQSGSIGVSGTTQWELGSGAKSTNFADIGVTLAANTAYRIVLEMVAGVRTGVFQ